MKIRLDFTPSAPVGDAPVWVVIDGIAGASQFIRNSDGSVAFDSLQDPADSDDLMAALSAVSSVSGEATLLVGCAANARPLAARIARECTAISAQSIQLVCAGFAGETCAADVYCAGLLIRYLLEELDTVATLDDAAGIAVALLSSYGGMHEAILASTHGRELERAGRSDLIMTCAQIDITGTILTWDTVSQLPVVEGSAKIPSGSDGGTRDDMQLPTHH